MLFFLAINKPKVWTESTSPVSGTQVHVQIDCIYPYPDEIRIDYVKVSFNYMNYLHISMVAK